MENTPFFPAWHGRWGRVLLPPAFARLRRCTLDQLEDHLGPLLPGLDALAPTSAGRRERPYSVRRTWWCFLWQMLQGNTSCRAVVRQLQALLALAGRPAVDEGTSAYCQARGRLPEALLERALHVSAQVADQRVRADEALQGRVVKVIDGTTLRLPDTAANQACYPQSLSQKPGCGFALLQMLVVWSARGGAVLAHVRGNYHHSEMRLLHRLGPALAANDIVVYDRAAGHYVACAWLAARGVDLISRVINRPIDWRRGQRPGRDERLVIWKKSRQQPPYLTAAQWAALPAEIPVRLLRVQVAQKGFRTRHLELVTTLLDTVAYPLAEIAAAYQRRWRLEMCLDDLKTTLGLDALRCRTPAMVHRELLTLLIAHNLVRAVMAEAAREHAVPLDRISFTGTLAALRSFSAASAQAVRPTQRRKLWDQMLRIIAADQVPWRPNRWEPRAVKQRPKTYLRLNRPRHLYRDIRHGCRFRRPSET